MKIPVKYGTLEVKKSPIPLDADVIVRQEDGEYICIWFEPEEASDENEV